MKIAVTNAWQMLGAITIHSLAKNESSISGNTLTLNIPKKEVFRRALGDLLSENKKPWRGFVRPFLKQYTTVERIGKITQETQSGSKYCNYCKRMLSSLEYESLVSFPLLVKSNNFLNFYSFGKTEAGVCLDCQFLGALAPLSLFFTSRRDGSSQIISYIVPCEETLERAWAMFTWMSEVQNKGTWTNINVNSRFSPSEPSESLLLLLHALKRKTGIVHDSTFWILKVNVTGRDASFEVNDTFLETGRLKTLLGQLDERGVDLAAVLDSLVVTGEGSVSTIMRDQLARLILRFSSLEKFLEHALFKTMRSITGLFEFLCSYESAKGGIGVDETLIEKGRKAGEIVGNAVFEEDSFGDLYNLRNSKTLDDFVEQLSYLAVKYAREKRTVRIPEDYLEALDDNTWRRSKALLVIFAVNKYLQRQYAREKNNGGDNR